MHLHDEGASLGDVLDAIPARTSILGAIDVGFGDVMKDDDVAILKVTETKWWVFELGDGDVWLALGHGNRRP